jgi:hypothetical protein
MVKGLKQKPYRVQLDHNSRFFVKGDVVWDGHGRAIVLKVYRDNRLRKVLKACGFKTRANQVKVQTLPYDYSS